MTIELAPKGDKYIPSPLDPPLAEQSEGESPYPKCWNAPLPPPWERGAVGRYGSILIDLSHTRDLKIQISVVDSIKALCYNPMPCCKEKML